MPKPKTGLRTEQEDLRVRMRALGLGHDEIAAEFARRYRLRPRAAYRQAHGWTLNQAAAQFNTCAATTGSDPDGKAGMTASRLSEFEHWPTTDGRKPTPRVLAVLARVYGTGIHRLLDLEDYEHLAPGERLLLDAEFVAGKTDRRADAEARAASEATSDAVSYPYPGIGNGDGGRVEPDAGFLNRVHRACADRNRGATIRRIPGDRSRPAYLEISENDGGVLTRWPVGIAPDGLDHEQYQTFVDQVDALYRRDNRWTRSELVCGGGPVRQELAEHARTQGVLVRSVVEFERLWDPESYLRRQGTALADDDVYHSSLYIPQRFVSLNAPDGTEPAGDVLAEVLDALAVEPAQFVLVLGDFGHGKTFLLRELARQLPVRLPHLVPVLVELRSLEKSHQLDVLLTQHMTAAGEYVDPLALARMLERGQLVLLFDGFDELALRVTYDRAAEYLGTVLSAVSGKAKVVLTSRHQHFATDEQWRDALSRLVAGQLLVRLGGFDDSQILDCLVRLHGGDRPKAQARFDRIRNISDLRGLSRNPRMLSFVADLDEAELRAVEEGGPFSSADLYEKLITRWLRVEVDRIRRFGRRAVAGLEIGHLRRAVTALASSLWEANEHEINLEGLGSNIREILADLLLPGVKQAEIEYLVGAGTLLVRRQDTDTFGFVHHSVTEYLVAAEAAEVLSRDDGGSYVLAGQEMSPLMVDFFCGAAGRETAVAWARRVLDDAAASAAARSNALAVSGRFGIRVTRAQLAGQDLRGRDLTGLDLRFADLSGADLRDSRLHRTDLTGALLAGARLADATLDGVPLDGADLTKADLTRARLFQTDVSGARLDGSRWTGAAVVGGISDPAVLSRPEMTDVAVAGLEPAHLVLQPPAAEARSVVFMPGGRLLMAAWGRDVVLIEPRRGRVVRVLPGHTKLVRSVAAGRSSQPTPGATVLASGGDDGTVRLWDAASGRVVRVLDGHTGAVHSVAFDPGASTVASGGDDHTVRLWDVASGRQLRVFADTDGPVASVAYSGDGTLLACAAADAVHVWDVATGKQLAVPRGQLGRALTVAFSPVGTMLATGDFKSVRLWDAAADRDPVWVSEGHDSGVRTATFSPDGTVLATGGGDQEIWLWDVATGRTRKKLHGQQGSVLSVAFDPDGALLAASGGDDRVRVWEIASGKRMSVLAGLTDAVGSVAFGRGAVLASAGKDRSIRLWETTSGRQVGVLDKGYDDDIHMMEFSPDGKSLACVDRRSVRLWEIATGRHRRVHGAGGSETGEVHSVVFGVDGALLVCASSELTVRVWRMTTGKRIASRRPRVLEGHGLPVLCAAFSPRGTSLASADSRSVRVWSVASGRQVGVLDSDVGPVGPLVFSPGADVLAFAGAGGGDQAGNGDGMGSGGVQLWELGSGVLRRLAVPVPGPRSLAFSPDGALLAVAGEDRLVRVCQVASGEQVHVLEGHLGIPASVQFSPDGTLLASGAADQTVRVWETHTGEPLATLVGLDRGGWAALFPNGSYKLVGDPGGAFWWTLRTSTFGPGELDGVDPAITCLDELAAVPRPRLG
ncbi:MAG: pentapeptide repeat-containing protein [Frankia sp.]